MKPFNPPRWCLLTAVCGLLFSATLWAQPEDTSAAAAETPAAMQPEADDSGTTNTPAEAEAEDSATTNSTHGLTVTVNHGGKSAPPIVLFGQNAELKKGQVTDAVVVIGGSAKIHGKVRDAVVAIGGNVEVDGEVGDAVVAVLGSVNVKKGAKVRGDAVAIGGGLNVEEGATVVGEKVNVSIPGMQVPRWVKEWFVQCVLKMRPLAPQVPFVWAIAGGIFLFYLLIALLFPRPVQACVDELTRRPATTFLLGLVTKMLAPVVFLILLATGVGLFIIPFVWVALLAGAIIGKIALAESIGFAMGRASKANQLQTPLLALAIGSALIAALYMVPVLGLLTFLLISVWGLGCAVTAAFGGMRKEIPQKTPPAPAPLAPAGTAFHSSTAPPPSSSTSAFAAETQAPSGGAATATMEAPPTATPQTEPAVPPVPMPHEALTYPRAGFWERIGADFLDLILVGILSRVAGFPMAFLLISLAYFSGMWAWKGTTVGGIVLGLKVVRLDGQPVTFAVALVRALGAAFSVVVLFLGFLWIAWDDEKQGWHDRIAGTVVVKLPRGTPLVVV